WGELPILLLLKSADAEERRQVFECGASDFVVLPIVEVELQTRVRTVIPEPDRNNLLSTIQM
ncbi:MAG TPA: hypothetical protein PKC93_08170, partial [Candidatus Obscuribacter sp.]|nr:hypothetical protein [Candidatus Obscuribacter sp.]